MARTATGFYDERPPVTSGIAAHETKTAGDVPTTLPVNTTTPLETKSLKSAVKRAFKKPSVGGVVRTSNGRTWDPDKHPRDANGRFIETGGTAKVWGGGQGRVVRTLPGKKVEIEFGNKSRRVYPAAHVQMMKRPNGAKPVKDDGSSKNRHLIEAEDARRKRDPKRGDGITKSDRGDRDGDGVPDDIDLDPDNPSVRSLKPDARAVLADERTREQILEKLSQKVADSPEGSPARRAAEQAKEAHDRGDNEAFTRATRAANTEVGREKARANGGDVADGERPTPKGRAGRSKTEDDGLDSLTQRLIAGTDRALGRDDESSPAAGGARSKTAPSDADFLRDPEGRIESVGPDTPAGTRVREIGKGSQGVSGKTTGKQRRRPDSMLRHEVETSTGAKRWATFLGILDDKKGDAKPARREGADTGTTSPDAPAAPGQPRDPLLATHREVRPRSEADAQHNEYAWNRFPPSEQAKIRRAVVDHTDDFLADPRGASDTHLGKGPERIDLGSDPSTFSSMDDVANAAKHAIMSDPDLASPDADRRRLPAARKAEAADLSSASADAMRSGNHDAAASLLDDLEKVDPDYEVKPGFGIRQMRDQLEARRGRDAAPAAPAERVDPTARRDRAELDKQWRDQEERLDAVTAGMSNADWSPENDAAVRDITQRHSDAIGDDASLTAIERDLKDLEDRINQSAANQGAGRANEGAPDSGSGDVRGDRLDALRTDAPPVVGDAAPVGAEGVRDGAGGAGQGARGGSAGRPDAPGAGGRDGGAGRDADQDGSGPAGAGSDQGVPAPGAADGPDGPERGGAAGGGVPAGASPAVEPLARRFPDAPVFRPLSQADLADKTQKQKARNNIAALRTLKDLAAEDRPATPEEQKVLAKWAGWGDLSEKMFGDNPSNVREFAQERAELAELMTPAELDAARKNTMNAHYTDAEIVKATWESMRELGFDGGQILEPGSGSGNFMGFAPDDARMVGVELDPITASISKYLYPNATTVNTGLEQFRVPEGTFDGAIGNVPFSSYRPFDPIYNPNRQHNLHNLAIIKAISQTREGGLVSVVTSSWTMDSKDDRSRLAMFDKADLVGAVRLPSGAHKETAGSDVLTDLLIFRRRPEGAARGDAGWINANTHIADGIDKDGISRRLEINDYFAENPGNVLGQIGKAEDLGTKGLRTNQEIVVKGDPKNVGPAMRAALRDIAANARSRGMLGTPRTGDEPMDVADLLTTTDGAGEGSLRMVDGEFMTMRGGKLVPAAIPKNAAGKTKRLLAMRDLADELLTLERSTEKGDDAKADALRARLNKLYDDYVRMHKGPINDGVWRSSISDKKLDEPRYDVATPDLVVGDIVRWDGVNAKGAQLMAVVKGIDDDGNLKLDVIGRQGDGREQVVSIADPRSWTVEKFRTTNYYRARKLPKAFETDPLSGVVINLEAYDPETNTAVKGALLRGRALSAKTALTDVNDPETALSMVLDRDGSFDLDRLAQVMGVDAATAKKRLAGHIFEDPDTGDLLSKEEYLSGEVRKKLRAAEAAAVGNPELLANVKALEAVLPPWHGPERIEAKLGSTWIPTEYVQDFFRELIEDPKVEITKTKSGWSVKNPGRGEGDHLVSNVWGTGSRPAYSLVESLLNQRRITVTVADPTDQNPNRRVIDKLATDAANAKAAEIADRFKGWLFENPDRADTVLNDYNDRMNGLVKRQYSDAPLPIDGLTLDLYSHQRSGVRRILNEPAVLLAHEVGAGKTYTMASAAMELRRRGSAKKPMIVVPNHMKEQWQREFLTAFPQAKVLAISGDDMDSPEKRRDYLAKAATGDWDAVIITHSTFKGIKMSKDAQRRYIDEQLAKHRAKLDEARADAAREGKPGSRTVKEAEKQLANREAKLMEKLNKQSDSGVTFEQLGVDYLMVDEAHEFKNLERISLTDEAIEGSDQASDLDMKLGYLRQTNTSGRYVTFATATPVSNSFGEIHTMLKYLRPDLLEENGTLDFDDFLANFAKMEPKYEQTPAGGFQEKFRIRSFTNAVGLFRPWQQVADVLTADDLDLDTPDVDGGSAERVIVPGSSWLKGYMGRLKDRAEIAKKTRRKKGADNILVINNDGSAAALHPAMVGGPNVAEGTKIHSAAEQAAAIYQETKDNRYIDPRTGEIETRPGSLQLMFLDAGTPGAKRRYEEKVAKLEGEFDEETGEPLQPVGDSAGFEAYEALKKELIASGIPAEKIAFMHDAKGDDAKKAKLFARARSGELAVLIGSTALMGVGTNVQDRAVALHHLDVPYRPSDLQQRNGRIVRQKNRNSKVRVLQYATEGSLDSRKWEIQARKGTFIGQLMKGDLTQDAFDEIDDTVFSAEEMAAHSSGNILLLQKITNDAELGRIRNLERAHRQARDHAQQTIERSDLQEAVYERRVSVLEAALPQMKKNAPDSPLGKYEIGLPGDTPLPEKRAEVNAAIRDIAQTIYAAGRGSKEGPRKTLGTFGGFEAIAHSRFSSGGQRELNIEFPDLAGTNFSITGDLIHNADFVSRLGNAFDSLGPQLALSKEQLPSVRRNRENARKSLDREFKDADRLKALEARAARLNELQGTDGKVKSDGTADIPEHLLRDEPWVEDLIGKSGVLEAEEAAPREAPSSLANLDAAGDVLPRTNAHLGRKRARELADAAAGRGKKESATREKNPDAGKRIGDTQTRPFGNDGVQVFEIVGGQQAGTTRPRVLFNIQRDPLRGYGVFKPGEQDAEKFFRSRDDAEKWAKAEAKPLTERASSQPRVKTASVPEVDGTPVAPKDRAPSAKKPRRADGTDDETPTPAPAKDAPSDEGTLFENDRVTLTPEEMNDVVDGAPVANPGDTQRTDAPQGPEEAADAPSADVQATDAPEGPDRVTLSPEEADALVDGTDLTRPSEVAEAPSAQPEASPTPDSGTTPAPAAAADDGWTPPQPLPHETATPEQRAEAAAIVDDAQAALAKRDFDGALEILSAPEAVYDQRHQAVTARARSMKKRQEARAAGETPPQRRTPEDRPERTPKPDDAPAALDTPEPAPESAPTPTETTPAAPEPTPAAAETAFEDLPRYDDPKKVPAGVTEWRDGQYRHKRMDPDPTVPGATKNWFSKRYVVVRGVDGKEERGTRTTNPNREGENGWVQILLADRRTDGKPGMEGQRWIHVPVGASLVGWDRHDGYRSYDGLGIRTRSYRDQEIKDLAVAEADLRLMQAHNAPGHHIDSAEGKIFKLRDLIAAQEKADAFRVTPDTPRAADGQLVTDGQLNDQPFSTFALHEFVDAPDGLLFDVVLKDGTKHSRVRFETAKKGRGTITRTLDENGMVVPGLVGDGSKPKNEDDPRGIVESIRVAEGVYSPRFTDTVRVDKLPIGTRVFAPYGAEEEDTSTVGLTQDKKKWRLAGVDADTYTVVSEDGEQHTFQRGNANGVGHSRVAPVWEVYPEGKVPDEALDPLPTPVSRTIHRLELGPNRMPIRSTETSDEFVGGDRVSVEPEQMLNLTDGTGVTAPVDLAQPKAPEVPKKPAPAAPERPTSAPDAPTAPDAPAVDVMNGIERHTPEALPGEKFPPTPQQQDVIDAVLAGKDTLVQAKAGAGKTTTLEAIARRLGLSRPDDKVAYIAFNKSVQMEAEGRMPGNVEPRTGHSIAYQWAPDWMKKRTQATDAIRRPDDVARHLGINEPIPSQDGAPLSPTEQAMAALRTVDTFANSADDKIGAMHLPLSAADLPAASKTALLQAAQRAWNDLDAEDGSLRLSLDHVRKQWALTKPDLSKTGSGLKRPATALFLDEAQDTPPVLAKVVADQKMQKVIVGDADQAIYGFTGATDYLSTADGDLELPLNKSWRFGPEVADAGNRFLELLGSKGRVEGGGGPSRIVTGMPNADAILVRSNAGMLAEAVRELEAGRSVGVTKGTKTDLTSLIDTARYLKGEGPAPARLHDDLAAFRTWDEVGDEAAKGNDPKLSMVTRMVDTTGLDALDQIVQRITEVGDGGLAGVQFRDAKVGLIADGKTFGAKDHLKAAGFRFMEIPGEVEEFGRNKGKPAKRWVATGTPAQREAKLTTAREAANGPSPDVTISTAHKAKGLEWDNVRIGDDFRGPQIDKDTGEKTMPAPEELRLAYVAVTRAQKDLDPGSLAWVYDETSGAEAKDRATPSVDAPKAPDIVDARATEGQMDGQGRLDVATGDLDPDAFFLQPDAPALRPKPAAQPDGQQTIDDLLATPNAPDRAPDPVPASPTPDALPSTDAPALLATPEVTKVTAVPDGVTVEPFDGEHLWEAIPQWETPAPGRWTIEAGAATYTVQQEPDGTWSLLSDIRPGIRRPNVTRGFPSPQAAMSRADKNVKARRAHVEAGKRFADALEIPEGRWIDRGGARAFRSGTAVAILHPTSDTSWRADIYTNENMQAPSSGRDIRAWDAVALSELTSLLDERRDARPSALRPSKAKTLPEIAVGDEVIGEFQRKDGGRSMGRMTVTQKGQGILYGVDQDGIERTMTPRPGRPGDPGTYGVLDDLDRGSASRRVDVRDAVPTPVSDLTVGDVVHGKFSDGKYGALTVEAYTLQGRHYVIEGKDDFGQRRFLRTPVEHDPKLVEAAPHGNDRIPNGHAARADTDGPGEYRADELRVGDLIVTTLTVGRNGKWSQEKGARTVKRDARIVSIERRGPFWDVLVEDRDGRRKVSISDDRPVTVKERAKKPDVTPEKRPKDPAPSDRDRTPTDSARPEDGRRPGASGDEDGREADDLDRSRDEDRERTPDDNESEATPSSDDREDDERRPAPERPGGDDREQDTDREQDGDRDASDGDREGSSGDGDDDDKTDPESESDPEKRARKRRRKEKGEQDEVRKKRKKDKKRKGFKRNRRDGNGMDGGFPHLGLPGLPFLPDGKKGRKGGAGPVEDGAPSDDSAPTAPVNTPEAPTFGNGLDNGDLAVGRGDGNGDQLADLSSLSEDALGERLNAAFATGDESLYQPIIDEFDRREAADPLSFTNLREATDDDLSRLLGEHGTDSVAIDKILAEAQRRDDQGVPFNGNMDDPETVEAVVLSMGDEIQAMTPQDVADLERTFDRIVDAPEAEFAAAVAEAMGAPQEPTLAQMEQDVRAFNDEVFQTFDRRNADNRDFNRLEPDPNYWGEHLTPAQITALRNGNGVPASVLGKRLPEEITTGIWGMSPKEMTNLGFTPMRYPGTMSRDEWIDARRAEVADLADAGQRYGQGLLDGRRDVGAIRQSREDSFSGSDEFPELDAGSILPGDLVVHPATGEVREVLSANKTGGNIDLVTRTSGAPQVDTFSPDTRVPVSSSNGRELDPATAAPQQPIPSQNIDRAGNLIPDGNPAQIAEDGSDGGYSPATFEALRGTSVRAVDAETGRVFAGTVGTGRIGDDEVAPEHLRDLSILAGRAETTGPQVPASTLPDGTRVLGDAEGILRRRPDGMLDLVNPADGSAVQIGPDTRVAPFVARRGPLETPEFGGTPGQWTAVDGGASFAKVPGAWDAQVVRSPRGHDWAVGTGTHRVSGSAPSAAAAKAAVEAVLRDAMEEGQDVGALPFDAPKRPFDQASPDLPEEAPGTVSGRRAEWVNIADVNLGDVVRVTGHDGTGVPLTESGYAMSYPTPVAVHRRGALGADELYALVVSEDPDGNGPRKVVYAAPSVAVARAVADPANKDAGKMIDHAESEVLTGGIQDYVPVDPSGNGLFPGAAVAHAVSGRKGTILSARQMDVQVRWEDGKSEDVPATGLRAAGSDAFRPDGWTKGGRRVLPGQVATFSGDRVTTHNGVRSEEARGTVVGVDGDSVTLMTPGGLKEATADQLKVVSGATQKVETVGTDRGFDSVDAAPRMFDPIGDDAIAPDLTAADRDALVALGFDIDGVSDPAIAEAASRIRHGAPLSREHARALAEAVRDATGPANDRSWWGRSMRRLADAVDTQGREPISIEHRRVTVDDIGPGDVIAVPHGDTLRAVRVERVNATSLDVVNEDGIPERISYPDEMFLMPDVERPAFADETAVADATEALRARTLLMHKVSRARAGGVAIGELATADLEKAGDVHALRERVAVALSPEAVATAMRRVSQQHYRQLDRDGIKGKDRQQVLDESHAAATRAAEEARAAIMRVINDAEQIEGESWEDQRARIADTIREAAEGAGADAARTLPLRKLDRSRPLAEQVDEIDALIDEISGSELDTEQRAAARRVLTEVSSRTAREIAAEALRNVPTGKLTPELVEQIIARAREAARRAGDSRRATPAQRRRAAAAVNAMRPGPAERDATSTSVMGWIGRVAMRFVEALAKALRALVRLATDSHDSRAAVRQAVMEQLEGGRDAGFVPDPSIPSVRDALGFARWRTPGVGFGMRSGRGQRYGQIPAAASADTEGVPAPVREATARATSAPFLDRNAADGGPGKEALRHLAGVIESGRRVDESTTTSGDLERAMRLDEVAKAADRARWNDAPEVPATDDHVMIQGAARDARRIANQAYVEAAERAGEETLNALRQRRSFGPTTDVPLNVEGDLVMASTVRWAAKHFPTDWIAALGDQPLRVRRGDRGEYNHDTRTLTVAKVSDESFTPAGGEYGPNALHELVHAFEAVIPELGHAQWAYHYDRTSEGAPGARVRVGDNESRSLANLFPQLGYTQDEFARTDSYPDAYMGREYEGMTHHEVMSMLMESLFGGSRYINPEMRQFALGVLADLGVRS